MVRSAEEIILHDNSKENRERLHDVNAEFIRYLKLEYAILHRKLSFSGKRKEMLILNTFMQ